MACSLAFGQQTGTLKVKTATGRAGVFVEPRYEVATTPVTIVAGKTVTVRQELKALPEPKGPFGRLQTQGPEKYAAVYVNGAYMGHVDEFDNFAQGLLLPPGQYTVKIVPVSGGAGVEQSVDLKANQTTIVRGSGK